MNVYFLLLFFHRLSEQNSKTPLKALGIAAFGPIDLNKRSKTYGFVTTTPKPGWRQTDLVGFFAKRFPEIPIGFDTDVNAAALSEYRFAFSFHYSFFHAISLLSQLCMLYILFFFLKNDIFSNKIDISIILLPLFFSLYYSCYCYKRHIFISHHMFIPNQISINAPIYILIILYR